MRIVWKDSQAAQQWQPMQYRKVMITSFFDGRLKGWIIDIPGDDNIYASRYCACNAIDKALGGEPRRGGNKKREKYGIQIVGKREDLQCQKQA